MPEFAPIDAVLRVAEARRDAAFEHPSPYRMVEGNPFADDCPLPECRWGGGGDRELAEHLGEAHGDLTTRQRASVLALRQGRVIQIADIRARSRSASARKGAHEARG